MKVVAPPELAAHVRAHSGRLFVWTDLRRCCSGGVTHLEAGPHPVRGRDFRRVGVDGYELWFDPGRLDPPAELHLEVHGRRRPRVKAYWNGCVFAG